MYPSLDLSKICLKMLCPYFELEATRISTFSDAWPYWVNNLSPEQMAKAGFLYRGSDDRTICFFCGLCLYQWGDKGTSQKLSTRNTGHHRAYLERTFGSEFINQHSNFRIPEEEFLSGTRFRFATPEEAADPTLARNPPVENEELNITLPN